MAGALDPMKTMLIVYHSMTGGTLQMAQAAAAGARAESGCKVSMLPASEAISSDVLEARRRSICFAGKISPPCPAG